jgi:hypothetical protein
MLVAATMFGLVLFERQPRQEVPGLTPRVSSYS